MADSIISLFPHIKAARDGQDITLDIFLDRIKDKFWVNQYLDVLNARKVSEDAVTIAKNNVPYVTISGTFSERKNAGLVKHSGFIAIDIDDVDPEETKSIICTDQYTYAAFTSISGTGLCVIVKINPAKHLDSFLGLQSYYWAKYQIVIDQSCKDVSRPRYVSCDPRMFKNPFADKFTDYIKIDKALNPTRIPNQIYVQDDFEMVVEEIKTRRLDITGTYHTWFRIGIAIADKFGEGGRNYYHTISENSVVYVPAVCDRQYNNCLKAHGHGVNIATFYYIAKHAGLCITSERTRLISGIADAAKRARSDKKAALKRIAEDELSGPDAVSIVDQVFDNDIQVPEVTQQEAVEFWVQENYSLRRNAITRYLENGPVVLQKKDFNTIWTKARKIFDKISFQDLERTIDSDNTPTYNPLHDFISEFKVRTPTGNLSALFASLQTDTGDNGYAEYFGTKWYVSMIASIYGQHSPLMLVLCGGQFTGKTEFFRRLLPVPLLKYYAESKLDKEKDDEILMTQKLIIMNDEMGGQTAKDEKRMKELTSKQVFSLREPYGKGNVDLVRLALLCATSNNKNLLGDPTGNRRLLPANIIGIDYGAYNAVDKVSLMMEAYHLYQAGFEWQLTKDDIKELNRQTEGFEKVSAERDAINTRFSVPTDANKASAIWLTSTEIKTRCEDGRQVMNSTKLGQELENLGFLRTNFMRGPNRTKGYQVIEIGYQQPAPTVLGLPRLPF